MSILAGMAESMTWDNDALCEKAARCWYVTGATAVGKTLVGIELARRLDAEIISLDSMAVYAGMDVGTAKPPVELQQQVPHHLIDIVPPDQSFSVAAYRQRALQAVDQIEARGRVPVFVGGTALYLKALLRGVFQGPPADWEFRRQVEAELAETGAEGVVALHERLSLVDPLAAHALHPHDTRRVIRALEVYRATGRPISYLHNEFESPRTPLPRRVFALRRPRAELHARIERRVDQMFQRGLIDEVRQLLDRYGALSHTASQAVGYREAIEYLRGQRDLAATIERVKARTRRFARHQETWFRGLQECRIFDTVGDVDPVEIVSGMLRHADAN